VKGQGSVRAGIAILAVGLGLVAVALGMVRPDANAGWAARAELKLPAQAEAPVAWGARMRSTATTVRHAMDGAARLTLTASAAAFALAMGSALLLFGAAASERRAERQVHRAVGASLRRLRSQAQAEALFALATAALCAAALAVVGSEAARTWWQSGGPGHTTDAGWFVALCGLILLLPALAVLMVGLSRAAVPTGPPASPARPSRVEPLPFFEVLQAAGAVVLLGAATVLPRGPATQAGMVHPASQTTWFEVSDASAIDTARLYTQLRNEPSVASVRLGSPGLRAGLGTVDFALADCGQCWTGGLPTPLKGEMATWIWVGPGALEDLGLELVAGRAPAVSDLGGDESAAWVSDAFAARNFERGEAVGRRLRVGQAEDGWVTVAGIFRGVLPDLGLGAGDQPDSWIALPAASHQLRAVELIIAASAGPFEAAPDAALATIRSVAPDATVVRLSGVERARIDGFAATWVQGWFRMAGGVAVLLSLAGLLANAAARMRRQAQEWAVRRALGAGRARLIIQIMAQQGSRTAVGVLLGAWGVTFLFAPLARTTGVTPPSPTTLAVLLAAVVAASLLGALPAALRTISLDPAEALRRSE